MQAGPADGDGVRGWQARCALPAALAVLVALAATGCAQRAWDLESLEQRHPALRGIAGHRLGEVTPYLLPAADTLTLFLCRWPDAARLSVSFPPDVSSEERRALEAALAAWQGPHSRAIRQHGPTQRRQRGNPGFRAQRLDARLPLRA